MNNDEEPGVYYQYPLTRQEENQEITGGPLLVKACMEEVYIEQLIGPLTVDSSTAIIVNINGSAEQLCSLCLCTRYSQVRHFEEIADLCLYP